MVSSQPQSASASSSSPSAPSSAAQVEPNNESHTHSPPRSSTPANVEQVMITPLGLSSRRDGGSPKQVLDPTDPLTSTPEHDDTQHEALDPNGLLTLTMKCSESSDDSCSEVDLSQSRARKRLCAEQILKFWNLYRIFTELRTHEQCVQFAEDQGLLPRVKMCSYHKCAMSFEPISRFGRFRCRKSSGAGAKHDKICSKAKGTFFENSKISLLTTFTLMYMYSHNSTYEDIKRETRFGETILSCQTISEYITRCRECVVKYELEKQQYETKIGGPDKVVQIGITSFCRETQKNAKHNVENLVIGMIEENSDDLRLEVCSNNGRSEEVMLALIKKHVLDGSVIHTSLFKDDVLSEHGYIPKKFNRNENVHTQHVKCQWGNLKLAFRNNSTITNFKDWLIEFSWRRRIRTNQLDPFEEVLKAVEYVYRVKNNASTSA